MTMMSSLVDWTWLSEYCQRWSIYQQKKLKSIENKDRKEKAIMQYTSKSVTGALQKYQEKKERNEQMKYLEQK